MLKRLVFCCLLTLSSAMAEDAVVTVEKPWIFAVPPSSKETAAFMVLVNRGNIPVRLTAASSSIAGRVSPMITTKTEGRMGMKDVDFFEIPARGRAVFKPGGDHLMFYQLKAPLRPDQIVKLRLEFTPGGAMEIDVPVVRLEPK